MAYAQNSTSGLNTLETCCVVTSYETICLLLHDNVTKRVSKGVSFIQKLE